MSQYLNFYETQEVELLYWITQFFFKDERYTLESTSPLGGWILF